MPATTPRTLLHATRSVLPSETANAVQSAHMASAFEAACEDVRFVYRSPSSTTPPDSHFARYGLRAPRKCHVLPALSPRLDWMHVDLVAFRRQLRKAGPRTVVYTRSLRQACVSASADLATFIELHDPLSPARLGWLRRAIASRRVLGLVATTSRLRDDLLAAGLALAADRILVANNAAAQTFLALPPARLSALPGGFHVGYAGSAFRGKGVEIVLAAAALRPAMTFHVIGPSETECAALGRLVPNIVFHGRRPQLETLAQLKAMDALLLPNQTSVIIRSGADIGAHTSPLKLFEYLSTGRPIVASDLPIFADILRDGENALLAPAADADAFCAQLDRLRADRELGARLGDQARRDFAERHTWDHRARRILAFIESLSPTS